MNRGKFLLAVGSLGVSGLAEPAEVCEPLCNRGPGFEDFEEALFPEQPEPNVATRPVFSFGCGPAVIVLHEITGATPELFKFAHRIADAGFAVHVPILFGVPNHPGTGFYALEQLVHVCLSREFAAFAANRSSPITDWIRRFGRSLHARQGGPGIGAVGLCLTGSFALTMMLDDFLLAPVVSEPALPLRAF